MILFLLAGPLLHMCRMARQYLLRHYVSTVAQELTNHFCVSKFLEATTTGEGETNGVQLVAICTCASLVPRLHFRSVTRKCMRFSTLTFCPPNLIPNRPHPQSNSTALPPFLTLLSITSSGSPNPLPPEQWGTGHIKETGSLFISVYC